MTPVDQFLLCGGFVTAAALVLSSAMEDRKRARTAPVRAKSWRGKLRGRGFSVTVLGDDGGLATPLCQLEVTLPPVARGLRIRKERLLGSDDLRTGDRDFDAAVNLEGDPAALLVALTPLVRKRIVELLGEGDFSVERDCLRLRIRRAPDGLGGPIEALVALATSMHASVSPKTLARRVASDDLPVVRVKAFQLLAKLAAGDTETKSVGARLLRSDDPQLREAGWHWALDHAPLHVAQAAVNHAIDRPPDDGTRLAILFLARVGDVTRVDRLKALATAATPGSGLARALAAWTRSIGDQVPPETLVPLLVAGNAPEVQAAAAEALGRTGTIAEVEPLLVLGRTVGVARDPARAAVLAIQRRLGDVDPGRISLHDAPSTDGGLSVAADGGAIAEVDDGTTARPRERG